MKMLKLRQLFGYLEAYSKLKDKISENKWLKKSSKNKFSFYGQNASIKINKFKIIEESNIKSI